MHARCLALLTVVLASCVLGARSCPPGDQMQYGCRIYGAGCACGYGCASDYIYRNKAHCDAAVRERSTNVCYRAPCVRGICAQTVQDPGFACKCEGTGFYGRRCEKPCPSIPMRGSIFPHECVVI